MKTMMLVLRTKHFALSDQSGHFDLEYHSSVDKTRTEHKELRFVKGENIFADRFSKSVLQ